MGLMPTKGGTIRVHEKAKMRDGKRPVLRVRETPGRSNSDQPRLKVNRSEMDDRRPARFEGPPPPSKEKAKRGGDIKVHDKAEMGNEPDRLALAGELESEMANQPEGLMMAVPAAPDAPVPMEDEEASMTQDESRYTDENDNGVSPEEQKQYDQFVQNGLRLIYDENSAQPQPGILDALSGAKAEAGQQQPAAPQPQEQGLMAQEDDDGQEMGGMPPPPIIALANTTVMIVQQLDDSSRQANKPVSNDVLFQGGVAILEELADVAEAAGIYDYTEEELGGATTLAMDMYKQKAIDDGRTDEQQAKSEWDQIVQADQQGQLGSVVPGLGAS